jgi:hypothetical protein
MKKPLLCMLLIAFLMAFLSMPVYANTEGTSSGTATVGNAAPTVSSLGLWTVAPADANNTNLNVDTEYWANCTIGDNNQLYDIKNVTYYLWEDNEVNVDSADSNVNHYTFAYLNATDAFDEIGPDGAGNSHLVSANCSDPTDHSATSGEYKLAFKLHKTANYTASISWKVNITVYDGADATANAQSLVFGVNAYYELTVDDASHGWTSVAAGSNDNLIDSPGDGKIDVTCTTNNQFKLQAKGSGDLTKGSDTIGLGNVTIHKDTLGSSISLTMSYADIGGITSETRGESQAKSFKLWIDIPSGTPSGAYTYTLSVQITGA